MNLTKPAIFNLLISLKRKVKSGVVLKISGDADKRWK